MQKLIEMRRNKKGFTLVEVIVVLVILAILAAIAIPSLTGYIDKAKSKADMADARTAYIAAQTLASEAYATKVDEVTPAKINELAGSSKYTDVAGVGCVVITKANGKVTNLVYTGDFATVTFDNGTWSSAKKK